jgi:hypothetical protein
MLTTIISGIVAFFQAIPTLDKWAQQFAEAYLAKQLANHQTDMANALLSIIKDQNQILLEQAIGSPNAGGTSLDQTGIIDRPMPPAGS